MRPKGHSRKLSETAQTNLERCSTRMAALGECQGTQSWNILQSRHAVFENPPKFVRPQSATALGVYAALCANHKGFPPTYTKIILSEDGF